MAQKAWNKKAFPEENSNEEVQYQEHTNVPKQTYILKNLDCANCAAKIERKIQDLPQVDFASLIFTTKQLQVAANSDEDLLHCNPEDCLFR
ncbi:heavy-metal-associated domain-containing protein [Clostridioides difficile]|nr:heavy-metal-associated domain-containing protein [Clostridioides difficile]